MTILVPIVMLGWIPLVLMLFAVLPPRRAVIASFLFAWLFLPMAQYEIQGLPNFTKMSATSLGVLLGIAAFDTKRLLQYRFRWHDIPMLVWLTVPMASSLHNGHGAYDGASFMVTQFITWGIPYLVGRLYFCDLLALRELAIGIVIGGLIYIPFCLYEVRMSPQLHTILYGYHQHVFAQSIRAGGWRPTVFMQHGLAVAMWMSLASMLAVWLWQTRSVRRLYKLPLLAAAIPLVATTVLCKSLGALALMVAGISVLTFSQLTRSARLVVLLLLVAPTYLTARIAFSWDAHSLVETVTQVHDDRARSLEMRIYNERRITDLTLQRPLFGWGRWGGYREVDDHDGRVVTDSLWILAMGQNGLVGLAAVVVVILLPAALFLHRSRMRYWHHPSFAPAAGLAVMLILFMIDSLFNSMFNPIYLLAAGGIAGLEARRMWA